ncbi:hypothetical protein P885DRAFT_82304 [Corynascus similis CBS 632.67]
MSSSDESEQLAYLAADGSDSEPEELDSDPDDESDENADGPSRPNRFFDLEAADSDDEQSGSGLSGTDNNYYSGFETFSDTLFPQFRSLPFELRHRVWQFFCPELAAKSRVFWFDAECNPWGDGTGAVVPVEGPFLEQQTRSTRSLLAIHRETRELVLKALPDTLHFGSHGVIRFNSANDIVFLDCLENVAMDLDPVTDLVGFAEHIRHLAVEPAVVSDIKNQPSALSAAFKNLETVYYLSSPAEHNPRHLRWCTSDMIKHYSVTTFEEEPGLGEDGQHMYCWPDLKNHLAFAEREIPLDALADDLSTVGLLPDIKGATFKDTPIWPIVRFLLDSDMRRYDDLLAWDGEAKLDWESSEDEDSSEPDEYESEGIDDSDISEDGSTSDNEGLSVVDDDDSSRGGSYAGDNSSVVSLSPSLGSQNEPIDLTRGEGEDMAPFSSPEPSSTTLQESEESAQESNRAVTQARRLKRRRAHVVESDSEDDSENAGPRKRARINNRRNPVVLSSSDEGDEEPISRRNRRASIVTSEEEEEEDENDEEHRKSDSENGQSGDESSDSSGTSSSSDEDEESDGDDAVPRPLSLVEKLQLHRETNPIPSSDDEGSAREEIGGDESDGQSFADFQDDEEGDEVSEDVDEHDQYDYGEDDDDQEGY